MHILHTISFWQYLERICKKHPHKKGEFHYDLAYTENPFINLCTSMSSGCCRFALFLFPKKNVLAANVGLLKFKLQYLAANFAEESRQ